ncbi:hypothetical protein PZ61_0235840 [Streptomyces sp. MNU77]|uniref:alcohol dehydrogenase catalytic domain-containing protein n=1 Tax=Streptomyces sp. MNU77 TaxID=1573406 RepID=UPI0005E6A075|nr:alcohol dehydrogenase catalytic domain-containing protein [Streptomyces sp. MNU77]OLO25808.1 hypothetical protein PZ61_0235840 [Streptomyces sp. MNU77]
MRAVRVTSPGVLEFTEVDVPVPGPGEVLLKVAATGLCHSDMFVKEAPPHLRLTLPFTPGHEIAGTVVEAGRATDGWIAGRPAAVYCLLGCGDCAACGQGEDNMCRRGYRGIGVHLDGGLAEYVRVPAANLVAIDGLPPAVAAPLTDAGLTAYHTVETARRILDERLHAATVVVIGIGGLGHLAVQLFAHRWVGTLIAVDVSPDKLALARRLGATHRVLAGAEATDSILSIAGGREADLAVDFVGASDTLALAADVVGRGGAVLIAGQGGGVLPMEAAADSRVAAEVRVVRTSSGSRRELTEVMDLAAAGVLRPETELFPLDRALEAFGRLEAGDLLGRAVITLS